MPRGWSPCSRSGLCAAVSTVADHLPAERVDLVAIGVDPDALGHGRARVTTARQPAGWARPLGVRTGHHTTTADEPGKDSVAEGVGTDPLRLTRRAHGSVPDHASWILVDGRVRREPARTGARPRPLHGAREQGCSTPLKPRAADTRAGPAPTWRHRVYTATAKATRGSRRPRSPAP